jgi:cold shock CspA family protein
LDLIVNNSRKLIPNLKMGFRSLTELQKATHQRQSVNSHLLAAHSATFRSLPELEKAFRQRHDVYSLLLTEYAQSHEVGEAESSMMGSLEKVFQNQGYGFIAPEDGSKEIFVHFRDIVNGDSRDLLVGAQMHFTLLIDECGKRKAKKATLVKPHDAESCVAIEDSTQHRYSHKMLLNTYQALRKAGELFKETASATLCKAEAVPEAAPEAPPSKSIDGDLGLEKAIKTNLKLEQYSFASGDSTPTAAGDSSSEGECISLAMPLLEDGVTVA